MAVSGYLQTWNTSD